MRSIGNLPSEPQARLFSDYLLTLGIRSEVERDSDTSWLIWVLDDEQLDAGRAQLERFRANPDAPEFAREAARADRVRQAEAEEQSDWRKRVHNRRRVFPGIQSYHAGVFTYVLIVASVILALYSKSIFLGPTSTPEELTACDEALRPFFISHPMPGMAKFLPEVLRGEVWRLFTPMFIHFSVPHIVFNMMWLFQLGSMVEHNHGRTKFLLLIAAFAVISNLTQYLLVGPGFGGMSGVNYGLVGYVWIRGRCDPASGLHLDKTTVIMSIAWFFLCFTGAFGPIANAAHAAGLVTGMALGWLTAKIALRNP
ncbi:MAG: Rhomboid protease GlpG [Verrucomicrobiota bacterium]|jgi:GlpG protein